jgi:anaerobic ribonucleoside-triphosphate reductase
MRVSPAPVEETVAEEQSCCQCPRCGIWSRADRCPQCGAHKWSVEAVQTKTEVHSQ